MKLTNVMLAAVLVTAACARTTNTTVSTVPVASMPAAAEPQPAPASPPAPVQQAAPVVDVPAVAVVADSVDTLRVKQADVTRRATEMFGESVRIPSTVADTATDTEPSWDIDVHSYESTARVEHYVRLFSGGARSTVQNWLQRGTRYEPMIRAKMREGGLPEDMYYLALIESGFDQNAYSRAAAVGMWQFMTSTARDMGMRVDWWIDERRDPFRSTTAAVRFIKDLNEQFGSLYLAAAAYNGGPGRVSRGLSRYADDLEGMTRDDLFFALAEKDYFRNETAEYVPQLIAAALIAKEPERYGMKVTPMEPVTYDSVRVGPSTPLAAIARAAKTSLSEVLERNPHVLRGMTPPKDSMYVRVPVGAADSFFVAFDSLPKSERIGLRTVTSKKGDTFASLGNREGLTAARLAAYNPTIKVLKSGKLPPGRTVLVPTPAVAAAALSIPDPSIERYGSSSSRSTKTHVVKSGETLGSIAKKYKTTTPALMKSNRLRRPVIFPGQTLIVSGKAASVASSSKTSKSKSVVASSKSAKQKTTTPKTKVTAKRKAVVAAK